jgi:hypothetical protein
MARGSYAPQEVVQAEVVQIRTRADNAQQRRQYNYVVRLSTADLDTGEPVMVNEYRTIASSSPLSTESVLNRIVTLFEEGG